MPRLSCITNHSTFLRNIRVMQQSATGPALKMHFDLRQDVRGKFMAKQDTLLSLANVHAVNESGQSSVDIDRVKPSGGECRSGEFSTPGTGAVTLRPFPAKVTLPGIKITALRS